MKDIYLKIPYLNVSKTIRQFAVAITVFLFVLLPCNAHAASASKIDANINTTLLLFEKNIAGAPAFLKAAKGVLVFPKVYGAGLGIGGEYGQGALRMNGNTAAYYNIIAGSFGLQLGAQRKAIIILFMDPKALSKFQKSEGFKIGVDAAVTVVDTGVGKNLDTQTLQNPIVGFVLDQKGLMYSLSLTGAKITRIHPNK